METSITEQKDAAGNITRITNDKGIPARYVVGAVAGLVGLALIVKSRKSSFFGRYITPLIMAAAYKKIIELVQNTGVKEEVERPALS